MPLVRRIDRYVFSECLGPVCLGFLVATILLLIRSFFDLAEAMIQRDVPAAAAAKLLALNLPHIVVITIPMALLFGILVAIGRLSADSELTALRAAGVSLLQLYRPILALSLLFTILNGVLMVRVLPWGNKELTRLTIEEFLKGNQSRIIEARVFDEILEGKTVYVFEIDPEEGFWKGVFIADSVPLSNFSFTVADEGTVELEDGGRRIVVELVNTLDQKVNLDFPEEEQISSNRKLVMVLEEDPTQTPVGAARGLREMTLPELRAVAASSDHSDSFRNRARVEIHKKFSIPAACLAFGLLALPLGFSRRASGKSSAFTIALGVIVVYYFFQSVGEEAAVNSTFSPWLAMWLPNLGMLAAGSFLLVRKNGDKSLLLTRLDRWIRAHSWRPILERLRRGRRTPAASTASGRSGSGPEHRFVLHMPHLSIRFPGRMDRYVLRILGRVTCLVAATCLALYVIIDFAGLLEQILENDIRPLMVIEYYVYYSLQILYTIAPMAVLLTTLVTFGLLSRSSEVIAAKAAGISLYRLALPALTFGLVIAASAAFVDFALLPAANSRQVELRAYIKGDQAPANRRRVTRQWFYSQSDDGGSFIYNYLSYRPQNQLLSRFQAFRFDANHRLTGHLYAATLQRVGAGWIMDDGWARTFDGNRVVSYDTFSEPRTIDLDQGTDFFSTEIKSSQEMNYLELRTYIDRLSRSGQRVPDLILELHNKIAVPLVSLVMVFVALPFSFRLGRQGALYGIGLALLIGVALYAVQALFTTLGESAAIPPVVAAWSPNVLFSLLSIYLFLGVRT